MRRWLSLALFVFLALSAPARAAAFELFGGAVVDADRGSIFVMQPGSGIAVLDAATGSERCSTRHAARPLLVRGDRLLGQTESGGNILRLYVFEIRQTTAGGCELIPLHRVRMPLRTGVITAIDQRIDSAFDVRAEAEAEGDTALVRWSYRESPAFPDSYATKGAFRVDLATGTATPATTPATTPRTPRLIPVVPTTTPRRVASAAGPVTIGVAHRTDGTRIVELARASARPGGRAASTTLDTEDVRALRLSSDDRSLLVAAHTPTADPAQRYVWSIHAIDTWAKQGEVRAGRSNAPFFVHDTAVIYRDDSGGHPADRHELSRPVRLVAQNLSDSRPIWSYPMRDTAYRGVRPPKQPHAVRRGGVR